MPPDGWTLELVRLLLGEEIEVVERGAREVSPSSRRDISAAQRLRCWIARVKRPSAVPWLVIAEVGPALATLPAGV
jgi:hypothetical protein